MLAVHLHFSISPIIFEDVYETTSLFHLSVLIVLVVIQTKCKCLVELLANFTNASQFIRMAGKYITDIKVVGMEKIKKDIAGKRYVSYFTFLKLEKRLKKKKKTRNISFKVNFNSLHGNLFCPTSKFKRVNHKKCAKLIHYEPDQ